MGPAAPFSKNLRRILPKAGATAGGIFMKNRTPSHRETVLLALFAAIIVVLAFTPLGFIPLPFIKMTIIHIPVILGALLLGPKRGACLGFLFGLTSLINNTVAPAITSFTFSPFYPLPGSEHGSWKALLVCFIPRILVGVIPFFLYRLVQRLLRAERPGHVAALAVAGVAGALTNTILVMGLIFFLFSDAYAAAKGIGPELVLGVILSIVGANGIPEAIGAGVLVAAIGKVLFGLQNSRKGMAS